MTVCGAKDGDCLCLPRKEVSNIQTRCRIWLYISHSPR